MKETRTCCEMATTFHPPELGACEQEASLPQAKNKGIVNRFLRDHVID